MDLKGRENVRGIKVNWKVDLTCSKRKPLRRNNLHRLIGKSDVTRVVVYHMDDVESSIASIPAASYTTLPLHLRSRLPRRAGDVTLCTHCSLDRLDRLEAQSRCWSGVICAAVMVPCPCTPESVRRASKRVRTLHSKVEMSGRPCRLDIVLVRHKGRRSSLYTCSDPWQYPINALRNTALQFAATELVLLLDVDMLPGVGIQEDLWVPDVYAGFYRACTESRRVVVLPALQQISPSNETPHIFHEIQAGLQVASFGKAQVGKMWKQGALRVLASHVYPVGHEPTDTNRWLTCEAMYQVQYKDGYEPYILCARRLVPWFDERFVGYGRNKVIHTFHLATLDFRFWVHPDWFVVHVDHPLSPAWIATLGPDPLANQRLSAVEALCEAVKSELISRPIHSGVRVSPGACALDAPPFSVPELCVGSPQRHWLKGARETSYHDGYMGHWPKGDGPPQGLIRSSSTEYLEAIHDLRFHYTRFKLRLATRGRWPLRSRLPRRFRDITLVTVATWDRLPRLAAQCRAWDGVICAAIFAPSEVDKEALTADLLVLHEKVEKAQKCRLDLILLEPAANDRCYSCGDVSEVTPKCSATKRMSQTVPPFLYTSAEHCPKNALRNAALEFTSTDLVLLLDVDFLPSSSLNECLEDEEQYNCLWRIAVEEKTALVVPSFEFSWEKFTASDSRHLNLMKRPGKELSGDESPGNDNIAVSPDFQEGFSQSYFLSSLRQQAAVITRAQAITKQGVNIIKEGLADGWIGGFRINHFPRGHGPTNFKRWRERSAPFSYAHGDLCCAFCRSYFIKYEEGFEPSVICSRESLPKFDERFSDYGFDKISFFFHLQLLSFKFRVMLHGFVLNVPHNNSADWLSTFGPNADFLQVVKVKALYQRFKRESMLKTSTFSVLEHFRVFSSWDLRSPESCCLEMKSTTIEEEDTAYVEKRRPENKVGVEILRLAWLGTIFPFLPGSPVVNTSGAANLGVDYVGQEISIESEGKHLSVDQIGKQEDIKILLSSGPELRTITSVVKAKMMHCRSQISCEERNLCNAAALDPKKLWACLSYKRKHAPQSLVRNNSLYSDGSWKEDEWEWDSTNWKLRGSSDRLCNCSVVEVLGEDREVCEEDTTGEQYRLKVSMSAGSWSPQVSPSKGNSSGGVAVCSFPPVRAVREVMLRYMVRFPKSFQWAKGGTLPGLWVQDLIQTSFRWRQGGKGMFSSVFISPDLQEEVPQKSVPSMSRPFYFVAGRWHAVQVAISVVDPGLESDLESESEFEDIEYVCPCAHAKVDEGCTKKVPFPYTLDAESVRRGGVLEVVASVDFEAVSKFTYSPCRRRLPVESDYCREYGAPVGILLHCYFGGKSQDWATPVNTHVEFRKFEVWTDCPRSINRGDDRVG